MVLGKSTRHLLTWDGVYPWLGYLIPRVFVWAKGIEEDEYLLFFIFVVPIGVCLFRAGIGPERGQDLSKIARWRVIAHRVLFAIALIVLMFFEVFAEGLAFAGGFPANASLSDWFEVFGLLAVLHAVYVILILASKRVINKKFEWEHDGVVY